jgi:hypothetical protein
MFVFLEMEIYLASTIYAHSQILTCNQQENSKGTKNTVGRENNLKQYLIILLINPFLKKKLKASIAFARINGLPCVLTLY